MKLGGSFSILFPLLFCSTILKDITIAFLFLFFNMQYQMAHFKCFLRNSTLWIAFLIPFSVLAIISGDGVLSILVITFLILVLSTIILIFSKQSPEKALVDKLEEDETLSFSTKKLHLSEAEEVTSEQQPASETIAEAVNLTALHCSSSPVQQAVAEEKRETGDDQFHRHSVRSQDLYSESESNDHSFSSEESDIDWPYSGKMGQSPECSDDSISDEESLIEIAIPSGHYLCTQKELEDPKFSFHCKPQDFSAENMLKQHSVMDLLAEISEMNEENLIEIDISMGSIKCSRFEIET